MVNHMNLLVSTLLGTTVGYTGITGKPLEVLIIRLAGLFMQVR